MNKILIYTLLFFVSVSITLGILIFMARKNNEANGIVQPPKVVPSDHKPIYKCLTADMGDEYEIVHDWKGKDLKPVNGDWEFFDYPDPTHGLVNYGKWPELMRETEDGKLRIDVGSISSPFETRKAIRINSKDTFDEGLFILRADHMPEGLGTWPSWWFNAKIDDPNQRWACEGEIDGIEGVNSYNAESSKNNSTLHTNTPPNGVKCTQRSVPGITNGGDPGFSGNPKDANNCGCNRNEPCPYGGAGVESKDEKSFGWGFNQNGGGVYAMELVLSPGKFDDGQVTIWFFPNGSIPCDIEENKPNPKSWDKFIAVKFNPCPGQFKNLQITLNTTLGGDWGSAAMPNYGNLANFDPVAATKAIVQNPENTFDQAYWMIDYMKVFKRKK
jgi:hypothetical protein